MQQQPPSIEKLRWQCRRGMLELDFVLRSFLDNHYPTLSADDQALFVKILDYQDQLLLDWVMGHVVPSDAAIRRLVALMQNG